jgi:hypothetical protein
MIFKAYLFVLEHIIFEYQYRSESELCKSRSSAMV